MGQEVRKSHTQNPQPSKEDPVCKIHWPCPASPPQTGWPGSAASSSCREGSSRSSWPAPPGSQTARCRSGTAAPPAWCGSAWSCPPLCAHRNRSSEPLPRAGYRFYTSLVPPSPPTPQPSSSPSPAPSPSQTTTAAAHLCSRKKCLQKAWMAWILMRIPFWFLITLIHLCSAPTPPTPLTQSLHQKKKIFTAFITLPLPTLPEKKRSVKMLVSMEFITTLTFLLCTCTHTNKQTTKNNIHNDWSAQTLTRL